MNNFIESYVMGIWTGVVFWLILFWIYLGIQRKKILKEFDEETKKQDDLIAKNKAEFEVLRKKAEEFLERNEELNHEIENGNFRYDEFCKKYKKQMNKN